MMIEKLKNIFHTKSQDSISGLSLESSAQCNLHCPHCVLRTFERQLDRGHMSPDTIRSVLPHLAELEDIDLTGWGEPLLNPAFYENLDLIRSMFRGRLTFTSNGSLLDEQGMDKLIAARVHSICFSVDAADEAIYKRLRPGGDYNKLVDTLGRFVEKKKAAGIKQPQLFATCLLRRDTLQHLPAFVKWARDLGLDGVVLQQMTGVFTERDRKLVTYSNYYKTDFNEDELSAKLAEAGDIACDGFSVLMPEQINSERLGGCRAFDTSKPFISAAGDITVCCVMAYPTLMMLRDGRVERTIDVSFGNVNHEPLETIWSKPHYIKLRQTMRQNGCPVECGDCISLYMEMSEAPR